MGYGRGGRGGRGKGGGGWGGGGGGWGGGGGGGNKPFWRQFVDPSEDPAVIAWCRQRVQGFLSSGKQQEEVEWLTNEYRNTIRAVAPEMGAAWMKIAKGTYALMRSSESGANVGDLKRRLVEQVKRICMEKGGRCKATAVMRSLPQDFQATVLVELRLKNLKAIVDVCPEECAEMGLRTNAQRNMLIVGEADGYDDAYFVRFDAARVGEARRALEAALRRLPPAAKGRRDQGGVDFLSRGHVSMGPEELEEEKALPGYRRLLPARARLPAFKMAAQICEAVRRDQVTLILGATGCGKTTQIPQHILEDCASRGEPCRVLATQPRRISAYSVADRVAQERGGALGGKVAYKIRFEDNISEETQLIFCTVGILLKVMQSNPNLAGATHIVVDEVHERDLHTDFLLTLLRRVLKRRADLKVILMSATVDPTAFQSYFQGARTLQIPGKTNYPIQELFLEDVLQALPDRNTWRSSAGGRSKVSAFSQGPLPGLPSTPEEIAAALPNLPWKLAGDVALAHAAPPEDIDYDMVQAVVETVHRSGEDGGILIFMPGWAEIMETVKRLEASSAGYQLQVIPLHSRMPTAEQQAIFQPPPAGRRKVIVSTILAETSITVEDIVFVIDTGRSRSTFFNEDSKVSALRTVWYAKANGFQRRGRSGRCRPGKWFRLYTSLQWEAMDEYELPEMLRSPLEELCLEVAQLRLGPPAVFLEEAISPPQKDVVDHAVDLLYNLGAVEDSAGATLTPLGEKLSRLQVHPMLGKMLLLAGLFRCFQPVMTICAALGYKSPFLCPMGKEKEANAAKRLLADGSRSDLVALANAYTGWCSGKARFANQHFLSHQTMDYIHRLRQDLSGVARDLLSSLPDDHTDHAYMADVCRAVLVAGLFPKLAWIRRYGKGHTLQGLKVVVHPGSVNAKESDSVVAFYDIQETSERWLYDTTVVSMAPCLLFAPRLEELHRGKRVVFRVGGWEVAVDQEVADDLLALRASLQDFIIRSVGHRPTEVHMAATDALSRLFSERAGGALEGGDDDEEDGEASNGNSLEATPQGAGSGFSVGDLAECYWPEDDAWLPATVERVLATGDFIVSWSEDGSESEVPADYLRRPPGSSPQQRRWQRAAQPEPPPRKGGQGKRSAQSTAAAPQGGRGWGGGGHGKWARR